MDDQSSKKRHRRTQQEIRELLERYGQSGLTQAEFAAVEGISRAGLTRHLSRERMRGLVKAGGFIEVAPLGDLGRTGQATAFRVRLGEALAVEVPQGFCQAEAAWLLSALVGIAARP